ncbi:Hypothetical predicted protein [Pelobates cultripes]|uniref:Uncharacterized protein n=1 Tax=Pelobates cultripes TaxID=61616 RepID=A0AAD1RLN0_PELCU|nr:Hypothetical predicted protein [Pelobates cultripes]
MGNKKKSTASQDYMEQGSNKKLGDLDRYFREKVKHLTQDEDSNMAAAPQESDSPPPSPASSEQSTVIKDSEIRELLQNLPSKTDLASMLAKLEESMQDKISDIARDVHHMGQRVGELEDKNLRTIEAIKALETRQGAIELKYIIMARIIEELDNRSRRNNLRLRGLPETQEASEDLLAKLQALFNNILQRPTDTPVLLDRAHKALRPKGLPQDKPRDVICRAHYFTLKEEILKLSKNSPAMTQGNIQL